MLVKLAETTQSPRIIRLLEASRIRGADQPSMTYFQDLAAAFAQSADLPWRARQAHARAEALRRQPVHLFPDAWLVGMTYQTGPRPHGVIDPMDYQAAARPLVAERLPNREELTALEACSEGAAPGHVTWHWDWILERGVSGLLADYRTALATAPDTQAHDFFHGVLLSLEALLAWNDLHLAALESALATAEGDEQARLQMLIAICRRVPASPATTFHEAVQSFYLQHLAVMLENPYGGNGPGRLDYYLWPYLERDLAARRCTLQDARELIDEVFIRIHERLQPSDGTVEAIVVGGSHPDGSSAVNPLSFLMVESIMALQQTHPSVYVRIPADPPPAFVDLATRYLLAGHNRAQILNDPAIVQAMTAYGMPAEDARMYTCGGCMEIVPQGMNSDLLYAGTHNVPKVVEFALTGGVCLRTGRRLAAVDLPALPAYASFEAFYTAFDAELAREMRLQFRNFDIHSETMAQYRPAYLLSSMTDDCFTRGRELHDGGARYHDYGSTPMGIPNAGDALYAVKRAVFDDHICTAEELLAAIRANFAGYETLRRQLAALPKFGQQHAEADAMTDRVLRSVCAIYAGYLNRGGGRMKPVILTFLWATSTGATLGATAYGALAGQPISQALTPQSTAMTEGMTAAISSHTGLTLTSVAGGASSMWDFAPQWATPETTGAILRTFLHLGGQIFQGNTTDVDTLRAAQAHPEEYPHLIVRVGGFSARFVSLNRAVQDEIISRHRHCN